jgi:DNA-binding beta-propeller fold protein YncE
MKRSFSRAELFTSIDECARDKRSYMHWLPKLGPLQMVDQYTRRATSPVGVVSSEPGQLLCSVDLKKSNGKLYCCPEGVAVLPDGRVAVVDYVEPCIQLLGKGNMHFLCSFGTEGCDNMQFSDPRGLCADTNGNIAIADCNNHRIQMFTGEGVFIRAFGTYGFENGQFRHPCDIAFTFRDEFVVLDSSNRRVKIFSPDVTFLRELAPFGDDNIEFVGSTGLCVTGDDDNDIMIVVCDTGNDRVQMVRPDGTFVRKFGSNGSDHGQFNNPTHVASDGMGNLVVSDEWNHRVQVFRSDGTFLRAFGSEGCESEQFRYPRGVAITADGQIVVVDGRNYRVQLWS